MKINPISKFIFRTAYRKIARLEHRIPGDERACVSHLHALCRSWNRKHADIDTGKYLVTDVMQSDRSADFDDFGIEEYIKLNSVLLATIWFSEENYDNALQIEALENIVREHRRNPDVAGYLPGGQDIQGTLQMLVRTYVETPDCPNELVMTALGEYDEALGEDEKLAFGDESLNYLAVRGELGGLPKVSAALVALEPGRFSDCPACIINRLIRWHILTSDYEGAALLIDKIFREKLACDLIPKATKVQRVWVEEKLGRLNGRTQSAVKTALKNLHPRAEMLYEAAFLLNYAHSVQDLTTGEKVLERFAGIIDDLSSPEKVLYCLAAFRFSGDRGYYDKGLELAERFDTRNGTSYYMPMFEALQRNVDMSLRCPTLSCETPPSHMP